MGSPGAAHWDGPRRLIAMITLLVLVMVGGVSVPTVSQAATTGTPLTGDNSFYAYVTAGESLSVTISSPATVSITDPSGTDAGKVGAGQWTSEPATTSGVWTVAVSGSAGTWDVSVLASGRGVPGRVWTPSLSLNEGSRPMTRSLWLINDSGFEYRLDLDSFVGAEWTMVANASGLSSPSTGCVPTYASAEATVDRAVVVRCGGYRIFFEAPAADLPATSVADGAPITVRPDTLTTKDLAAVSVTATRTTSGAVLSWTLPTGFSGGYELFLDLDGTGKPSARNRTIQLGAASGGKVQYTWDGRDGTGSVVDDCSNPSARLHFSRLGEIHVPQYDVEGRQITLTRLTGAGVPDATMYWDDTHLTEPRATTTPILDGTAGHDSRTDRHGWAFDTNSWGNNRTIDDWAYQTVDVSTQTVTMAATCTVATWVEPPDTSPLTPGQATSFDLDFTNPGLVGQPRDLVVDLTGVADDAAVDLTSLQLPEWLTATVSGMVLHLTGTVPPGVSAQVRIPATVHATRTGDDRLVATLNGGPAGASSITRLVGRTSVQVFADPVPGSVVTPGENLTYTVTVAATGAAPSEVALVDDLIGVLDDAAWVSSVSSDPGVTASMAGGRVTISGSLAAGHTATVTTTVTVGQVRGDNVLTRRVTSAGAEEAPCQQDQRCSQHPVVAVSSTVTIAGAEQPVQAGDLVTISLDATNTGAVVALADETIDLSGVLDDAVLTGPPTSPLAWTSVGGVIWVSGPVEVGQTATLRLTARILADGARGDSVLAVEADEGACTPQTCAAVSVVDGGQVFAQQPGWSGTVPALVAPGDSTTAPATAGTQAPATAAATTASQTPARAATPAQDSGTGTLPSTGGGQAAVMVLGGWLTVTGAGLLAARSSRRRSRG